MRRFVDLNLTPKYPEKFQLMIKRAKKLGFSALGLPVSINEKPETNGVDIVSRLNLCPDNPRALLQELRKKRMKYEVISITCKTKSVAIQAAKDHRVDILRYPHSSNRRGVMFNNQQASLASESNCHIEFNINELLDLGPELLAEGVKQWDKEIWNAKRKNIPIIVSSGASTLNRMREPRALSAIMDLVDVIEEESLDMVSVIPLEMVRKNREKLDSSFVSPSVWRVT